MIERIQKLGRGIHDLKSLRDHLQVAIEVEHCTIPPYLCALYSLHGTTNATAAYVLRSIVMEEMLHMSLAANVLNAVGGHPHIDKPDFVPEYPTKLPHSSGELVVHLSRFSQEALTTFLRIERPEEPHARPQPHHYDTLGQFYLAIEDGLKEVCAGDRHFVKDHSHQVTSEHYYGGGGALQPVTNLADAVAALQVIRTQGEGADEGMFDGDPGLFGRGKEYAHYFRFNELFHQRFYSRGDRPKSKPSGDPLPVGWKAIYPMRANPHASHYPEGSGVRHKMDEFNRAYSEFLRLMHQCFRGEQAKLIEATAGMYALKYCAIALMNMPSGDGSETAGPAFEYVPA